MPATPQPVPGRRFACSWSGGKDGALALHRFRTAGGRPARLLTMMTESGDRSRSHGLTRQVLEAQAACLGLELRTAAAAWADYETAMTGLLAECAAEGIPDAVFGDIDVESHRAWEERVCAAAGMTAHLPLWQADRHAVLEEGWAAGFETMIIVVRDGVVGREFLGRYLDPEVARALTRLGVDPCGENGEFHTIVTGGPIFEHPLEIALGEQVLRADCWVQDLGVS